MGENTTIEWTETTWNPVGIRPFLEAFFLSSIGRLPASAILVRRPREVRPGDDGELAEAPAGNDAGSGSVSVSVSVSGSGSGSGPGSNGTRDPRAGVAMAAGEARPAGR